MVKIAFSADIDVGAPAIDRDSYGASAYTWIGKENPANATGTIDHIEIWATGNGNIEVASFEEVSENTFTTRGSSGLLTVLTGLNIFNAPGDFTAFDINEEDYIGIYTGTAYGVDITYSGEGMWFQSGDLIPCTNQSFNWYATATISLYATGTEGEAPPPAPKVQSQILMLGEE